MAHWATLEEAAACVPDGALVALGGFTLHRRPTGLVRALLRRTPRPRDLTLLGLTLGVEADVLIGAGCAAAVRTAYVGLEVFGLAPMFTAAATSGALRVVEETEASLVFGLRATAAAVSFMPSHAWAGTDLFALRPDVARITDPYTGAEYAAFPAITPDVALLHALAADEDGNVLVGANPALDFELMLAARTVIVTVEARVAQVVPQANTLLIPARGVDVLALAPRGALPTSCYPAYPMDGMALLAYTEQCAAGRFEDVLAMWCAPQLESDGQMR